MNCKKCGYELKEGWKICPKCSEVVTNEVETINVKNIQQAEMIKTEEKQDISKSDGKDKLYLIIFLISIACGILIEQISGVAFLVALISIVTGFIKYPKNRAIKILFWLFSVGIALYIIFVIVVIFMCANAVSSCGYNYR